MRRLHLAADPVGGSFQTMPPTPRPFKIRAVALSESGKTETRIVVAFTQGEAAKLVADWEAFGVLREQS